MAQERTLPMGKARQGGKFVVDQVLGEGTFGTTDKGTHKSLQRTVAIKKLFPPDAMRMGTSVVVAPGQQHAHKQEIASILQGIIYE